MTTNAMLEKALNSAGGGEELQRKIKLHRDNLIFIEKNKGKLLAKYGDTWIAVRGSRILTHGSFSSVAEHIKKSRFNPDEIRMEFISKQEELTLY